MQSPRPLSQSPSRFRSLAAAASALSLTALLSGCAGNVPGNFGVGTPQPAVHFSGSVYGGQQPVVGSTIQLYAVGTSGLGSASTALISPASQVPGLAQTDANGNFNITGQYTCPSSSQVYIVATGGNPGSGPNSAVALAAALGDCATLQANAATTFISINEVTTVAAAYALAPFAADMTHIGAAGSSPSGLVNAFTNAGLLANTSNGTPGGASLANGVSVPGAEINTLGNILAACVNTGGPSSTQCNSLLTATNTTDTFDAAFAIAKSPGAAAITGLYSLSSSTAPFQPSLSSQPADFSVAVTMAPSGKLSTPYGIAIDANGNAWVTNESSTPVSQFSPAGALLSNSMFTQGFYGAQSIAFTRTGDVWLAVTASNTLQHCTIHSNGIGLQGCGGSTQFVTGPAAVASDSAGQAFIANLNGNSVSAFTMPSGAYAGTYTGNSNNITVPNSIALDSSGNVFVTSGQGGVVKLSNAGAYVATFTDNALQGPSAVAVDVAGDVIVTGFTTGSATSGALQEFDLNGNPAFANPIALSGAPAGIAISGNSIFVANGSASGGLQQLTYGSPTLVSPAAGFGQLNAPVGVAVDASGCVWTTNSGNNSVSKFIGLTAPVVTPLVFGVGPRLT